MLYTYYALCLSCHSKTEAVLFACLSSGWATTTGRLLVLLWEIALSFSQGQATRYRIGNHLGFVTFRLLACCSTKWATRSPDRSSWNIR